MSDLTDHVARYLPPQAAEFGICDCREASVTTQIWRLVTELFTNERGDVTRYDNVLRCDLCGRPRAAPRKAPS